MARRFPTIALCVLAASLLTACAIFPWGKTFELELRCQKLEIVNALYVIVGESADLEKNIQVPSSLLRTENQSKYRTLAQFTPVVGGREKAGDRPEWKLECHDVHNDQVTFSTSTNPATVIVDFKHKLAEQDRAIALILVASFKSTDWKAYLIHSPDLENTGDYYLDLSSAGFTRQDK